MIVDMKLLLLFLFVVNLVNAGLFVPLSLESSVLAISEQIGSLIMDLMDRSMMEFRLERMQKAMKSTQHEQLIKDSGHQVP
jgi:hypothetical protein